jgi:hypothetical protein
LGLSESEEEMVAGADNYNAVIAGYVDLFYAVISSCAVYLYIILRSNK